jgi:uncharacterized protein (TIGR02246 family)
MSQPLKAFLFAFAGLLAVAFAAMDARAQGPAPTITSLGAAQGNDADEQAIRATADEFVKAFNAGDAKTIGLEWSDDARYTDESGQEYDGRTAIENEYAKLFKERPGATITVDTESIRFFGPDIAIEKGVARAKLPNGDPDMASHYTVVHARRDGKWVMVVGRDAPYVSSTDGDYLKDLEWLIGDWQTGTKEQQLRIKFEWIADRNFIRNTYTVVKAGKSTLTGGQIIGWDPRLGKIVSWHFDASGGFGNDVWTKEGANWVVRATGTLRDGSDSSATNVITPIDANDFSWQSDQRTLDGVSLPDTGPVKITRADAK